MEVAAFHPSALATGDSSLWPSSSRRRARALPCIPLCGARTFLCACATAAAWPTPAAFYRAEAGSSARPRRTARPAPEPARIAEDRQRRQVARLTRRARARRARRATAASGSAPAGTTIALQVMPGQGSSACSSTAWPKTRCAFPGRTRLRAAPRTAPSTCIASRSESERLLRRTARSRRPRRRSSAGRAAGRGVPPSRGISRGMQGVDARLGARESEPGEGVEEIVQVVRPRLDARRSRYTLIS